ncbi:Batten's disease protein Cln3 [Sarocladium strictum]
MSLKNHKPVYLHWETKNPQRDGMWATVGYAFVGFANVLMPCIIFSSSYLIVPYPRGSVILIEAIPAFVVKLILPHLIHREPHYIRPIFAAIAWSLCGFISLTTPPNVEPLVRIIGVLLAAATASYTDISMLGMMRYYGRHAVTGWGIGTGLGYVAAALMPYIVTVTLGDFLRSSLSYLFFTVPLLLWGHYYLFTIRGTAKQDGGRDENDHDDYDRDSLLIVRKSKTTISFKARLEHNLDQMGRIAKPFMQPLYGAAIIQAFFVPGLFRAAAFSDSFSNFFSYFTAYSAVFHLGNLVGRSSIIFVRVDNRQLLTRLMGIFGAIALLNGFFAIISTPFLVFGAAALAGVVSGGTYINAIDGLLETSMNEMPRDCEFLMGAAGVAEAASLLIGGLMMAVLENMACEGEVGIADRWCYDMN